jgi:hypothetical protein
VLELGWSAEHAELSAGGVTNARQTVGCSVALVCRARGRQPVSMDALMCSTGAGLTCQALFSISQRSGQRSCLGRLAWRRPGEPRHWRGDGRWVMSCQGSSIRQIRTSS